MRKGVFLWCVLISLSSCDNLVDEAKAPINHKHKNDVELPSDTPLEEIKMEVEAFKLSWPGDDILCDSYEGSEGPYSITIYRLKETKKIVYVSEHGAYCQGDSDFANCFLYDENGNAVYSYSPGMYAPSILTLYKNGVPDFQILSSGEGEEMEKPLVKKPVDKEKNTSNSYSNYSIKVKEKLRFRLKGLQNYDTINLSEEALLERIEKINEIKSLISSNIEFEDAGFYRYATYKEKGKNGEVTEIYGIDLPVFDSPEKSGNVLAMISSNDENIEVIDKVEKSSKRWCKVRFKYKNREIIEGWILEKFLIKNIFEKE